MSQSQIGPLEPSELHFILSSWKKSYREACANMRTDPYYKLQGTICDEILSRFPLILVCRNQFGSIDGWICAEATPTATVVHYCYTKSRSRRQGIAKLLLDAVLARVDALEAQGVEAGQDLFYTHKTRHFEAAERYGFKHLPIERFLRSAA